MGTFLQKLGSNPRVSKFALSVLLGLCAIPGYSEDFPAAPGGTAAESEFEKGFAENKGMTQSDKDTTDADRFKLGGTLWSEFQYYHFGTGSTINSYFLNPNSLWLYGDARLKNDVRGVVKLKAVWDPTANGSVNALTGTTRQKITTDLEELKLLFSADKTLFFTVGKQKIKWGSAKFWNVTDFLNATQRNFLYSTDLRSGVTQMKIHLPVGASNFYLIEGFDDADQIYKVRTSVRAEIPIGTSELALSATTKNGVEPSVGIDISAALWVFDVYFETGYSPGNQKTFFSSAGSSTDFRRPQWDWTAGISYDMAYADNDTATFSAEYFYNGLGSTTTADYPFIFVGGGYQAFRLSRQYGLFSLYLPNPGAWNKATFTLFHIMNLTDFSAITRLDSQFKVLDDLTFAATFGVHYGNGDGEFKYGGQVFDVSARFMIDF